MKGKALEKFQEYVYSKYEIGYYQFLELPLVCQQALWVEWFESIGFHIGRDMVNSYWLETSTYHEINATVDEDWDYEHENAETLDAILEKATEIFNNNNNGKGYGTMVDCLDPDTY